MTVLFTDTFDTGDLSLWDGSNVDDGCSITAVADPVHTAPYGILVDHPTQAADNTDVYAYKAIAFGADIYASFYLRLGDVWTCGGTQRILQVYNGATRIAGVGVSSTGAIAAMSPASQVNAGSALLRGIFYHVWCHIHLDTVGTTSYTTVKVNGKTVCTKDAWTAPALPDTLRFGIKAALKADASRVWLDDLTVADTDIAIPEVGSYAVPAYPLGVYCGNFNNPEDLDQLETNAPALLDAGVHQVSFNLAWSDVETSPGVYDWTFADTCINRVLGMGFALWVRIGSTPTFYIPEGAHTHTPPTDMTKLGDFVSALRDRYSGVIAGINHVYNEPNGPTYFDPRAGETRPQSYALVAAAVGADATVPYCAFNPEGRYINNPVTDLWAIDNFIAQCFIEGLGSDYDYMGIHNYPGNGYRPPEYIFGWAGDVGAWEIVDSARFHAFNAGCPTRLAITEVGWYNTGSTATETTQARFTVRHILHGLRRGMHHYHAMFLYDLTDNKKGWFDAQGVPHAVVAAVGRLNSTLLCHELTYVDRVDLGSPYLWCYRFTDGSTTYTVCWGQGGEIYGSDFDPDTCSVDMTGVTVPVALSDGVASALNLVDGTTTEVTVSGGSATLDLTNDPVLFTPGPLCATLFAVDKSPVVTAYGDGDLPGWHWRPGRRLTHKSESRLYELDESVAYKTMLRRVDLHAGRSEA